MIGFAVAWLVVIWLAYSQVFGPVDTALGTALPQRYGHDVLVGKLPYAGFGFEYPPLALPTFVLPALVVGPSASALAYRTAFEGVMLACGLALIPIVILSIRPLAQRRRDLVIPAALLAASPLLLGPMITARFDLWPALLTAAAIAAVLADRPRIGAGLLALAILAKVYPIVLAPLLVAAVWRRRGGSEALISSAVAIAVVAVVLGPFLVVAPAGTLEALRVAVVRQLQVETLGASFLLVLHGVAGTSVELVHGFGSENLGGTLPKFLAVAQSVASLLSVAFVWLQFMRGPGTAARLLTSIAAALCLYVALGKVFSPQYLIWLVPLVATVPRRVAPLAILWLAVVLLLTEAYFPIRFFDLVDRLDPGVAAIVLLRDTVLLGLAFYLVWLAAGPSEPGNLRLDGPAPELVRAQAGADVQPGSRIDQRTTGRAARRPLTG